MHHSTGSPAFQMGFMVVVGEQDEPLGWGASQACRRWV